MIELLTMTQPELKNHVIKTTKAMGYEPVTADGYVYCAGTLPVMLVAHLDKVNDIPTIISTSDAGNVLSSPQGIGGDDRAGVYMLFRIGELTGCHLLFCEDEEIGRIGAGKFTRSDIFPAVNYIVELDRRGDNDAVFYNCANLDFIKFIESFDFVEARGSCSDISEVAPHLDIAAVNISTGYYQEHSTNEYIRLDVVETNIERVAAMITSEVTESFAYYVPR
jgi:hypothetical protein